MFSGPRQFEDEVVGRVQLGMLVMQTLAMVGHSAKKAYMDAFKLVVFGGMHDAADLHAPVEGAVARTHALVNTSSLMLYNAAVNRWEQPTVRCPHPTWLDHGLGGGVLCLTLSQPVTFDNSDNFVARPLWVFFFMQILLSFLARKRWVLYARIPAQVLFLRAGHFSSGSPGIICRDETWLTVPAKTHP